MYIISIQSANSAELNKFTRRDNNSLNNKLRLPSLLNKSLNTSDEDPNNKKENTQMQKEEIGLYKNVGVTKIKGKLGFPKAQHNKEQIKKALKSQGVDIKFLDEE